MKKICWILCFGFGFATAQELDSVAVDTVNVEPPTHFLGAYLTGGISWEASAPNHNIFSVFGVGIQYERWMLGFSRNDFQGSVESFVIFPNTFELKYRYGGVDLGYQLNQKSWMSVIAKVGYYRGDMVWRNQEDGQNFLRDEFSLVKLGLMGELAKMKYIKPSLSAGYQKMNGLNLARVASSDFSGLFIVAGIRIGYFNQ